MGVGVIGMGEGMGGCWAWLGKFVPWVFLRLHVPVHPPFLQVGISNF